MTEAPSDWSLVDRVKAGDDRAFDALMARYKLPVTHFVFRMVGDAAEADDVAQTVFIRAYTAMRRPEFHATAAFSTWLFQVARHAAIDALRRRGRMAMESLDAATGGPDGMAAPHLTARDIVADRETGARIAAAVARLPEDQRAALVLAEYEAQSHAAIAAVLGCSEKSVESRLYRARQSLRRRLADLLK